MVLPVDEYWRYTAEFPHFQSAAEGVLNDVFRQRQVVNAENARQRGDDPAGFPRKRCSSISTTFS